MNPCTACTHYKEGFKCGLTGEQTERARAYKTDANDCFNKRLMPQGVTRNEFELMIKEDK